MKKAHQTQDESMEVDGDQASVRVSKDVQPSQPKDQPIHSILARIPSRPMQQNEKASGRMRLSAYRYCIQFQDGVTTDECEWWMYEYIKDSPNFEMARLAFQTLWEALYAGDRHCPDLIAGVQLLWPQNDANPTDVSDYYSILFGIAIVDWEMHESKQREVIYYLNPLVEMYFEGFQVVQEKFQQWREDRLTAVSQLPDDQYACLLELSKAPATTVAQYLNSVISTEEQ